MDQSAVISTQPHLHQIDAGLVVHLLQQDASQLEFLSQPQQYRQMCHMRQTHDHSQSSELNGSAAVLVRLATEILSAGRRTHRLQHQGVSAICNPESAELLAGIWQGRLQSLHDPARHAKKLLISSERKI